MLMEGKNKQQFTDEDKEQDFESDDDDLIISPAKNLFSQTGMLKDSYSYSLSNEDDRNTEKMLEKKKRKNKKKKRKRKEKKIMQQQQT